MHVGMIAANVFSNSILPRDFLTWQQRRELNGFKDSADKQDSHECETESGHGRHRPHGGSPA